MNTPEFKTLAEWLAWQETLHPREIELGLDRVSEVASRLSLLDPDAFVVTVGGTNGKGSSVHMLTSAYISSGYKVGSYTSPHVERYNERICINGVPAPDDLICDAFSAVAHARQDTSLTYFEFGTLAALWVFKHVSVDVMLLEVGLGGRLDAVNILDADLALITNVGLDHTDWLGNDRDVIGAEKAGILRCGQMAVYNDPEPVDTVATWARSISCDLHILGKSYSYSTNGNSWSWASQELQLDVLPANDAPEHQIRNAAGVLKALVLASDRLPVDLTICAQNFLCSLPPGRGQWLEIENHDNSHISVLLDVAHNTEAVHSLQIQLSKALSAGKTYAIFAVMKDKPVEKMVQTMRNVVDEWHVSGLPMARACTGKELSERLNLAGLPHHQYPTIDAAWQSVLHKLSAADRVVVFGSFFTIDAILNVFKREFPECLKS